MTNPSTPSPTTTLINKQPLWKAHPGPLGSHYYINSVSVSADGSRVLGGTFFRS